MCIVHRRFLFGLLVLGLLSPSMSLGQAPLPSSDTSRAWHDDAWTPIVEQEGLQVSYIYYPEADTEHDGVVLRLINENESPVRYSFTLIFRAPTADTTATVDGRLGPGEMKTGDAAGLFWVPFRNEDRSLGEIGLRGLSVARLRPDGSD
jgi:hypothetical protein